MIDESLDIAAVRRVRLSRVLAYLKVNGWEQFDEFPGRATLWRLKRDATGDDFEVLLPTDSSVKDFSARMVDLLGTLAAAEGRSVGGVLATLITPIDAMNVQIEREDTDDGTISLSDGARAFQGVKELFHAAAASLEEPRAFYSARSGGDAAKFLRSARLGQTQRGSYVIAVQTPIPETLFHSQVEPIERRVLRRLVSGIGAARDAAYEGTEEAFKARVVSGVSANLCLALAKFGGGKRFRAVTLRFNWAWTLPVPQGEVRDYRFTPPLIDAIREGGERLKFIEPKKEFILVGKVKRLEHEGEAEGTIAIEGQVDHKVRRVTLVLQGEDHEKAIQAYQSQELVRCLGELVRHGRSYHLVGAKRFGFVLPDTEPQREPEPA
ncbi:MAG TPA: hypothetical protein VF815_27505 [Myxococcaceae bacterium]